MNILLYVNVQRVNGMEVKGDVCWGEGVVLGEYVLEMVELGLRCSQNLDLRDISVSPTLPHTLHTCSCTLVATRSLCLLGPWTHQ